MYRTLLLFLSILFLFSCGGSKEITFKEIKNIKLKSVNAKGIVKVNADAILNNPRRVGAKVKYLECDVLINGVKYAELAQIKTAKVPKRSDFSVPLETSISLQRIIGNAGSLARSVLGKGEVDLKMDGTVKVKVFGKTFTVPFEYEEPTKIKLK